MRTPDHTRNEVLARNITRALKAIGVEVLDNSAAPAGSVFAGQESPDNAPLYIVGIGSHFAHNDDPKAALASAPHDVARVVLMHNPDSFPKFPAGSAPVALAGHTHGGQVRIPFTPAWTWMNLVKNHEVRADGWIRDFGQMGNRLYVNRGIGFSYVPIRINCRPEVTIFTLRRD